MDRFQYVEYVPILTKRQEPHTNLINKTFPTPAENRSNVRNKKTVNLMYGVSLYRHIATLSSLVLSSGSTVFLAVPFLRRFGLSGIGFKSNASNLALAISSFLASAATLSFSFPSAFCASFSCAANDFTHTRQP